MFSLHAFFANTPNGFYAHDSDSAIAQIRVFSFISFTLILAVTLSPVVHATPLTFDDALRLSSSYAPILSASHAEIEAASRNSENAGALPDPKGFLGVNNFPLNGMDRFRFNAPDMTMQEIGVMQEIPNRAKRDARVAASIANIEKNRALHHLNVITTKQQTAEAWLECFYLNQKIILLDALSAENRLLEAVTHANIAAGDALPADALMARTEDAALADRRDDLTRDIAIAHSTLRRLIGDAAERPLAVSAPQWEAPFEQWRQIIGDHPQLLARYAEHKQMQAQIKEAEAEKKPDWGIELAYQRQRSSMENSNINMIMLRFSFTLPLFTETRQNPMIRARYAEETGHIAMIENERQMLAEVLEQDAARDSQNSAALQRLIQIWLPLLDEKIALQETAYAAGKAPLATVLDARRERIEMQLKKIDLEKERAQRRAQWALIFGERS
ncbi:MAG: TolC family protein [Burkholderiales bacterium]|nr:TolC family protein [Burkholderiales bacterium]